MRRPLTRLAVLAVAVSLAGCSLTPTQKKWMTVGAGVIVTGAVIAHRQDHGDVAAGSASIDPALPCRPQPDGTCR